MYNIKSNRVKRCLLITPKTKVVVNNSVLSRIQDIKIIIFLGARIGESDSDLVVVAENFPVDHACWRRVGKAWTTILPSHGHSGLQ